MNQERQMESIMKYRYESENEHRLSIWGNVIPDDTVNESAPWECYKNEVEFIRIEEGVQSIGKNCFRGYPRLHYVDLPRSVKVICEGAFSDCPRLTSVRRRRQMFFYSDEFDIEDVSDDRTICYSGAFFNTPWLKVTLEQEPKRDRMSGKTDRKEKSAPAGPACDSKFLKRLAIHEAGHAVVCKIVNPSVSVVEVSILGDKDTPSHIISDYPQVIHTESVMKGKLATLFGGRNAEKLLLGEHSDGCKGDMQTARMIADDMIENMAMGEFGVTTSMDLLMEADRTAAKVLEEHKEQLIHLAELLFEKKTIVKEDIDTIFP